MEGAASAAPATEGAWAAGREEDAGASQNIPPH